MNHPFFASRTTLALLLCAGVWLHCGTARAFSIGGHLGLNLNQGDIHLGVDLLFPVVELAPSCELALWPSIAHVFKPGHDVELLGLDIPFMFKPTVPIVPFVGPGFGVAIYEKVSLKFNVVGGVIFNPEGRVKPFGEIALRFIDGEFVDALFGVLVEI